MNPHIFKRKIYDRMLSWKKSEQGASALLLQGARRVGKSTIAREFAKNEYESYICIDFSSASAQIFDLWNDISDLNYIFLTLQNSYNVSLTERNSVIIFDEIQLCPKARQAIKHLVADGRYDYIETGSLLSIKQNIKNIIIPSEETRISMYPLDFEEFLWATGKPMLFDQVRYAYNNLRPLGDALNRSMMKEFRLYMLVGGMPQAIVKYLDTNDFRAVDAAKRNILELYAEDFRKIDPKGQITELFRSIPAELGRNTLRYKIGSVIKNGTASRLGVQLANMADSLTVNFAYHADDPSVGFALHANRDFFKLFLTDTGLLVTLAFMDRDYTQNDIYHKLLTGHLAADLGYVYETQ